MSVPDKGAGPQISQDVLYNNGGVITAATIFKVNADGTVNLVWYGPVTPATVANNVQLDPTLLTANRWAYPQFQ